jgi:hypothetical protein
MADRSEISKAVAYVMIGQPNALKLTKCVAYFVLEPGEDGPDTSNRQGHVHTQIMRRR